MHLLEWLTSYFRKTWKYQLLMRKQSNRNSHSSWECKISQQLWKTISYKVKQSLTIWSSHYAPRYLPNQLKNPCPHKSMQVNVDSSFLPIIKTVLQQVNMSFNRWVENYSAVEERSHQAMQKHQWILDAYIAKWKESIWKGYGLLWFQFYGILQKAKL